MHLAFSGNTHPVFPLSKDHADQGAGQIAVIPCSDYLLYLDPTHQELKLMLRRGMDEEDLPYIPYDKLPADLVVSSFFLTTPDGQSIGQCGGICTDSVGQYIYLLYISPPQAYIKVIELRGEEFRDTHLVYPLPTSAFDFNLEISQDTLEEAPDLSEHLGEVTVVNQHLLGSGIAYHQGNLYALTRRQTTLSAGRDCSMPILTRVLRIGAVVAHLRLTEVRTHEVQYSSISQLNAETGQHIKTTPITYPSFENLEISDFLDGVFNGLAIFQGQLLSSYRTDMWPVPQDTQKWHLQSQLFHWEPPELSLIGGLDNAIGVLKWEYANTINGQPPPVLLELSPQEVAWHKASSEEIVTEFSYIFESTDAVDIKEKVDWGIDLYTTKEIRVLQSPIPRIVRGQSAIAQIPLQFATEFITLLPRVYPLDFVLPISIAIDDGDCKFFAVIGDAIWTFDLLNCTIIVNYEDSLFEGDIIDFGLITEGETHALQCFIQNSAPYMLYNVQMHINLKDDIPRREDIFLALSEDAEGFKSIILGDIPSGGSKQFYARAVVLNVSAEETKEAVRVPLRVTYNLTDI